MSDLREIQKPTPVSAIKVYAENFKGSITGEAFNDLFEYISEKEAEIERLKTERNKYRDEAVNERELTESIVAERDHLIIDNERLTEQLNQVIEVLKCYADERAYESGMWSMHEGFHIDGGRLARQLLQSIKGGETDATQTSD